MTDIQIPHYLFDEVAEVYNLGASGTYVVRYSSEAILPSGRKVFVPAFGFCISSELQDTERFCSNVAGSHIERVDQESIQDPLVERLTILLELAKTVSAPQVSLTLEDILGVVIDLGLLLQDQTDFRNLGGAPMEHPAGIGDSLGNVLMLQTKVNRHDQRLLRELGTDLIDLCQGRLRLQQKCDNLTQEDIEVSRDLDDWDLTAAETNRTLKHALREARREAFSTERHLRRQVERAERRVEQLRKKLEDADRVLVAWCPTCGFYGKMDSKLLEFHDQGKMVSQITQTRNLSSDNLTHKPKWLKQVDVDGNFSTQTGAINFD
jgi:hypothetical protein